MEIVKIGLIILAVAVVGCGLVLVVFLLAQAEVREQYLDDVEDYDDIEEYEAALSDKSIEDLKRENHNIKRGVKK